MERVISNAEKIFKDGILEDCKTKTKEEMLWFLIDKQIISQKNVEYWSIRRLYSTFLQQMSRSEAIEKIKDIVPKHQKSIYYIVQNLRNKFT